MDQKEYLSMTPEQRSQHDAQNLVLCSHFDDDKCDSLCRHTEKHVCDCAYGYCAWRDIMVTECK